MKKTSGLGRGLQSLIPSKKTESVTPRLRQEKVYYVETHKIKPNSQQPRREFGVDSLKELASSIKKYGVLQPLLVQKHDEETEKGINVLYELIAGERRLRASKLAGLAHVPVIIKDNYDEDKIKLELALVENLQREDLNPVDEAEAYHKLITEFGMTQSGVAGRVGKSREVVANAVRLLSLAPNIKEALREGKILKAHGRTLLAFKNEEQRQQMFSQILAGKAVVRDIEAASQLVNPSARVARNIHDAARFYDLQENLTKRLDTIVFIKSKGDGGKIEIKFDDLEQLNTIAKSILD